MELGGSMSTLPSGDRAVFFPNSKLVSAATTSSSIALTIPSVELCGIKCTTTMPKFRRVPMEESPTIYDIPEPCQIWTGIWTSLGRGLQSPARRSFGRSNRSSAVEFPYLPPLQISARSDGSNSGNLPMSGPIFGSVFYANKDPTRIHISL